MRNLKDLIPGIAATMMGIGFARFSFTPLAALYVDQKIISSQNITVIATFMMAAYFLGAVFANGLAQWFGAKRVIRTCFLIVVFGLAFEGMLAGYYPSLVIRFLMNFAGACLMVLGPAIILSRYDAKKRGMASGIVFTGIGVGIVIAGSIVSVAAVFNAIVASSLLFVVGLLVVKIGWRGWDQRSLPAMDETTSSSIYTVPFIGLLVAYCLDAIAFIPHTVYLSDFVSTELGQGVENGGYFWAIFGLGGVVGALSATAIRKVLGSQISLELILAIKAVAILVVYFSTDLTMIAVSAFIVGALVPGLVMLISTRTLELVGPTKMTQAWGVLTAAFAIGQLAGAAGMAAIYTSIKTYQPLFGLASLAELLGLFALILLTRFHWSHQKEI